MSATNTPSTRNPSRRVLLDVAAVLTDRMLGGAAVALTDSGYTEVWAHEREETPMAELEAREAKLIQYLNEAYGKEKELETALQAHLAMTTRDEMRAGSRGRSSAKK